MGLNQSTQLNPATNSTTILNPFPAPPHEPKMSFLTRNLHIVFPLLSLLFTLIFLFHNQLSAVYQRWRYGKTTNTADAAGTKHGSKKKKKEKSLRHRRHSNVRNLAGRMYEYARIESEGDTGIEADDEGEGGGEGSHGGESEGVGIELDVLSGRHEKKLRGASKRGGGGHDEAEAEAEDIAEDGANNDSLADSVNEFVSEASDCALSTSHLQTIRARRHSRSKPNSNSNSKSTANPKKLTLSAKALSKRAAPEYRHAKLPSTPLSASFGYDYDASSSSPAAETEDLDARFSSSFSAPASPMTEAEKAETAAASSADGRKRMEKDDLRRHLAQAFNRHPHGVTRADLGKSGTFKPYPRLRRRKGREQLREEEDGLADGKGDGSVGDDVEIGEVQPFLEGDGGSLSGSFSDSSDDEDGEVRTDGTLVGWFEGFLGPAVDRFVRFIGEFTGEGVEKDWVPGAWRNPGLGAGQTNSSGGRTVEELLNMNLDEIEGMEQKEGCLGTEDGEENPSSPRDLTRQAEMLMYGATASFQNGPF